MAIWPAAAGHVISPAHRMAAVLVLLLAVSLIPTQASLRMVHSAPDIGGKGEWLLAVPSFVPFTDTTGTVLVRVPNSASQKLVLDIRDSSNECLQKLSASSVREAHTDRHGRTWLHVPLGLTSLPEGPSTLQVWAWADGRVWGSAGVKVVKARPRSGGVLVDNGRGRLVGSDGLPLFPFGSYTYGVVTEVERGVAEEEAQFGMNWIAPYLSEAGGHTNNTWTTILQFLDRCHQLGVLVHYDLHALATLPDTPTKWQLLQTEVKRVMDHPAVAAYYLADEPGGQHIDPGLLEKSYDFVKSLDPHKPVTMVFCCVDPKQYINSFDIGMADPYPIPNSPPESVALKTALLAKTGKPFFIVPQAFGGGEGWERTPTPAEERVMTYVSVITGAVGIQYFVRSPHQFPYAPTAWSECRRLALEFRELSSAILSGHAHLTVQPSPSEGVLGAGWGERVGGGFVVAAVNYLNKPVNVILATNSSYTGIASVLFQNRNTTVVNGVITDVLLGYSTAVYRFPPTQSSRVSPANVMVNPSFEQITSPGSPDGAYLDVPADLGSSYLADSRLSVDGLHSLRLVTPTAHNGFHVKAYPINIKASTSYQLSFWAISTTSNLTMQFSFPGNLSPTTASFQTSTQWVEYTLTLKSREAARTSPMNYQLTDSGTVWIDLLQLVPQTAPGKL